MDSCFDIVCDITADCDLRSPDVLIVGLSRGKDSALVTALAKLSRISWYSIGVRRV